jgi:hypothetical protein
MPKLAIAQGACAQPLALGVGIAAVLGLLVGSGCAADNEFGGIWRGTAPAQGAANPLLFGPAGEPLALELVLGEYGPDLSGLMRFYRQGSYVRARDAAPPDGQCACALVYGGRSDSGKAAFSMRGCLPGSSPQQPVRTRATLARDELGVLRLHLQVDDATSALNGQTTSIELIAHTSASEISSSDLICPPGPSAGNPASGQ